MSNEPLEGGDSSTVIVNKIINKIKYFIKSSSSSSSSSSRVWRGLECLLNPENKAFTIYVLEHKAFTLDQIIRGSGLTATQCRYAVDKLVASGLLIESGLAKGVKKPHVIYLFRGEDQDYALQALRLHNDEFGGQRGLEESLRLEWVGGFVSDLDRRHIDKIQKWRIARRAIEENGGFDKNLELAAIKAVRKAGIEVIY